MAALWSLLSQSSWAADSLSLAGQWRYALDRQDVGVREQWPAKTLAGTLTLPGSLSGQGIGDPITTNTPWIGGIVNRSWFTAPEYAAYRQPGNVKVPFWLQPETYYAGVAWYQREITVPPDWAGRRVVLWLERPHWETRVWVDGRFLGTNASLSVPHQYDLGQLSPGTHALALRVDNRMVVDIGENSHSVSDHTQGNWNGVVGGMELRSTPLAWVDEVQVYPNAMARTARVRVVTQMADGAAGQGELSLNIEPVSHAAPLGLAPVRVPWQPAGARATNEVEVALGPAAQLWDEFSPAVYRVRARIAGQLNGASFAQESATTFGLREIATRGTQFLINDRVTFFRGTLDCCIYPKTGHPPTDVASWKRVIGVAKDHGLNLIRFHSWCPPEAAFVAADELGFYFHVEAASWANQSTTLGDGKPVDQWIYDETDLILRTYGNHPSFVLMPYGNEPGGEKYTAYLARWVAHFKQQDTRRLYTSGAGWPQIPENQFHLTPDPRVQAWGEGLKSRINGKPPETMTDYRAYIQARSVPVVSHEIGQWCVYPNFEEIPKYTGYLKPRNFEIFRDTLAAHHMAGQAKEFLLASGKLQTLCYKEDIESALRTPGMGGFELLDLHDFPGQGSALVGVLDPFWEGKGYVTPAEFRRFCAPTVPLARLPQRVFTTAETLRAAIEVAHYGPAPLTNVVAAWELVDDSGRAQAAGRIAPHDVPVSGDVILEQINVPLAQLPAPARYKLVVRLVNTPFTNDWDVWVYPAQLDTKPDEVLVTEALDASTLAKLNAGGKVLLLIPPAKVKNDKVLPVALGFSSIFWNTAWTASQPPTTLGILCDPKSPPLAGFPTDYHSNWQWWYLISQARAMLVDGLPAQLRPTVQVIDDWVTARRLALVFEGRVGAGKLVVCSIDLQTNLDRNPVARQLRHSLLTYMNSRRFKPQVALEVAQIKGLIQENP